MTSELAERIGSGVGLAAVWLTVLAAGSGCIASYCSRISAKAKAREFAIYKEESRVSVANANEVAALANQGQAKANEAAALANQRAATLEVEAAQARLELEKLRFRSISSEQRAKFMELVRSAPKGQFAIGQTDETESRSFATEIATMLREAGYTLNGEFTMTGSTGGVHFTIDSEDITANTEPAHAIPMANAFKTIGLPFTTGKHGHRRGMVRIFVGRKNPQ